MVGGVGSYDDCLCLGSLLVLLDSLCPPPVIPASRPLALSPSPRPLERSPAPPTTRYSSRSDPVAPTSPLAHTSPDDRPLPRPAPPHLPPPFATAESGPCPRAKFPPLLLSTSTPLYPYPSPAPVNIYPPDAGPVRQATLVFEYIEYLVKRLLDKCLPRESQG
ncbi:uncharacterized protein LOC134763864 [Penaeus indicus]|uniref:uncharacterized protein LOC134763864 n=1 Tax=Penaeus indicus TaxID=29960 RepID=UPI00300D95A4